MRANQLLSVKSAEDFIHRIIFLRDQETIDNVYELIRGLKSFTSMQWFQLVHWAIKNRNFSIFSYLYDGVSTRFICNRKWFDDITFLHLAVESAIEHRTDAVDDFVAFLLKQGAKQIPDKNGEYPIQLAYQAKHILLFDAMLKAMLEDEKQLVLLLNKQINLPGFHLSKYRDQENALLILNNIPACVLVLTAARCGDLDLLKYAARMGWSLRVVNQDRYSHSPVELAAQNGHLDVVKWLIEEQGLSLKGDKHRAGLIYYAATNAQTKVLEWMLSRDDSLIKSDVEFINLRFRGRVWKTPGKFAVETSHFLISLPYLFEIFALMGENAKLYSLIRYRYQSMNEEEKTAIHQIYENKITELVEKKNDEDEAILKEFTESYIALQPLRATQFVADVYSQYATKENQYHAKVISHCLLMMEKGVTEEVKKLARVVLADFVFNRGNETEKDSPLAHDNIEYLSMRRKGADSSIIGRAIQAFYWLQDIEGDSLALLLKKQIHAILSFQDMTNTGCSEVDWDPLVREYYTAYLIYKSCPMNQHISTLLNFTHEKGNRELAEEKKKLEEERKALEIEKTLSKETDQKGRGFDPRQFGSSGGVVTETTQSVSGYELRYGKGGSGS